MINIKIKDLILQEKHMKELEVPEEGTITITTQNIMEI